MMLRRALLLLCACLAPAVAAAQAARAPVCGYELVASFPHDPSAFTQGLLWRDGHLYESTGLNGRSSVRKVRLETGEVLQAARLEDEHFGEGLADWGERLLQLTWRSNVVFVWDRATLRRVATLPLPGEAWGLAHDGKRLILSDGSERLRFLDPKTLKATGSIVVTDGGQPVRELNELEFVRGEIYANVWHTERIARISPQTGRVLGWIDLAGLGPLGRHPEAVLNGIAYDAAKDRLFVTGKLWPRLFEIRVGACRAR